MSFRDLGQTHTECGVGNHLMAPNHFSNLGQLQHSATQKQTIILVCLFCFLCVYFNNV